MDKLGLNIYDLFRISNKKLSPQAMSHLIQEFILRAKELHECGIIHRDVKPENFCILNPYCKDIYLIDFGLSKDYIDKDHCHRPRNDNEGFVGTPRYSSRNAHKGICRFIRYLVEQERRFRSHRLYVCFFDERLSALVESKDQRQTRKTQGLSQRKD